MAERLIRVPVQVGQTYRRKSGPKMLAEVRGLKEIGGEMQAMCACWFEGGWHTDPLYPIPCDLLRNDAVFRADREASGG